MKKPSGSFSPASSLSPPFVSEGSSYVLFLPDVVTLVARWHTNRLRKVGIDAYWESHVWYVRWSSVEPPLQYLSNVYVAQPHLLPAMIMWKLSWRGVGGWQRMEPEQRCRLAEKVLVDSMLLSGGEWDEAFFTGAGLHWLQTQLGAEAEQFHRLLGRARRRYKGIARRDVRLGTWLSAGFFAAAGLWWLFSSTGWPAILFLLLAAIFGVHTLVSALPRSRQSGTRGLGSSHPPVSRIQEQLRQGKQVGASGAKSEIARARVGENYLELGRCLARAKEHLNHGDAHAALAELEGFAADDFRGVHTAYPEFYEILLICQRALGQNSRNSASQIEEMRLDWMTALDKGRQLLRAGRAKESIAYFQRSLKTNPGEAGTAAAWEEAEQGIRSAKALLKRQKE